jgi:hypothetical protein
VSISAVVFVAIFFGGMLLALTRHPTFGLYIYVLVFYLHPPSRWWGVDLPDLRWSLIAAAATLVATLRLPQNRARPSWLSSRVGPLLVVCTLWLWIQTAWAMNPEPHQEAAVLFTKYIVLFYVIYRLMETEQDVRNFLVVHIIGCFFLSWLAYDSPNIRAGRLDGVGGPGIDEPNALSMQIGTAVLAAAMLLLTQRHRAKWLLLIALPFMLNAIVLCGSRGSFLAIICGGVVMTLYKPRAHRRTYYTYAGLAVLLFAMLASQFFWERMGTMQEGVQNPEEMEGSAASRLYIADAQVRIFFDHPLGVGHRGTELLTPTYSHEEFQKGRAGRASHNTFLTMLTEQGFVGAGLFVLVLIWAIRSLRILRSRYERFTPIDQGQIAALAASLTCVFIAGFFVDYFKSEIQVWLLALLAARVSLVVAEERRADATKTQNSTDWPRDRAASERVGHFR